MEPEFANRYRLAIESGEHIVWDLNVPTGTGYISRSYFDLLGYERDSFVETYSTWLERLHPVDGPPTVRKFEDYLAGKTKEFSAEFQLRTAAGGWVWIRSSGAIAERDEGGRPTRVVGTFTEISPLKQAQQSLQLSEQRLRHAIELARLGTWTWDCGTGAVWWSPEIYARYGVDPATFTPSYESFVALLHPEDRPIAETQIAAVLAGHNRFGYDARIVRPDGRIVWITCTAEVIRDSRGQLLRLEGIDQDITEHKQAEAGLRAEQVFTGAILENASALIVVLDREGRIQRFNRAAEQLSGYSFEEVVGRYPWETILPPETAESIRSEAFETLIRQGGKTTGTYANEWVTRSGARRLIEWYNNLVVDEQGRFQCFVAVGVDITERQRAQMAVRTSEAKLRAIFESEPECVKTIDSECRLLEMNPAGLAMIGASSIDEVRGVRITDLICAEDREKFRTGVAEVFQGRQSLLEYVMVGLDGVRRHVEQHAVGLRDPQRPDVITRMLAITRDVTQRRRAAEAEARRIARLEHLSEAALPLAGEPDAVFESLLRIVSEVFDVPVVCLTAIEGAELQVRTAYVEGGFQRNVARYPVEATPCSAVASTGKLQILDHVADRFPRAQFLRQCCAETYCGAPAIDEAGRVIGVLFVLDRRPRRFSEEDQHMLRLFGQRVAREIEREREQASRRAMEEHLRQSQQRLFEAQRIAHIGDWLWDIATDSITWSDEAYRIFGYEPQSFVPRYEIEFLRAIHPDDRERVVEAVAAALDGGRPYQVVHRVLRPDGEQRTVRERGEATYDDAGRPVRMLGTVQDITDIILAQEQAESLRSELAHVARLGMLGEMVAGIAHELNQPLAAIANDAYTVRRSLDRLTSEAASPLLQNARKFAQEIEAQAVRGGDIIRRLMTLLRKTGSYRTTVGLRKLIDEVLFLLATEIRDAQVGVDVSVAADLPEIFVDSVQIQQVLLNLFRNAIEAMNGQERRRQLTITAEAEPADLVVVKVRDTGPGFAAAMQGQIFTPFATTKPSGLGFGLAITRRIVEAHGGQIDVHTSSGSGVEVAFTLPTQTVSDGAPRAC